SFFPVSAQDTVDRLLRLHFRDGRTRGTEAEAGGSGQFRPALPVPDPLVVAVNADAQLLMAELLKVFVRGERAGPPRPSFGAFPASSSSPWPGSPSHGPCFPFTGAAEAAARAARQAQAEDLKTVDTEQLEKVLPQLVCN
ncbi:CENPX protein, partial [Thryothorus ludovicianus]|nr:CENPX protein [Thryothorus ludovicianus]